MTPRLEVTSGDCLTGFFSFCCPFKLILKKKPKLTKELPIVPIVPESKVEVINKIKTQVFDCYKHEQTK